MYDLTLENIYSSLYEDIKPTTCQDDRVQVLATLTLTAQTARELATICGFETKNSSVYTRKVITELIECDHKAIVATSKGFRLANSIEEMSDYREHLNNRLKGLVRRIQGVDYIIALLGAQK